MRGRYLSLDLLAWHRSFVDRLTCCHIKYIGDTVYLGNIIDVASLLVEPTPYLIFASGNKAPKKQSVLLI